MITSEIKNEFANGWEEKRRESITTQARRLKECFKIKKAKEEILTLDIEPTNDCTLRCSMCCRTVLKYHDRKNITIGYMDINLYRDIIDEAVELGVHSIRLSWYGEPLMHPQLGDMIKYAKKIGIEDVGLNTNAILLDRDKSMELIESRVDRLVFSIDSPYKEQYERIRVGAQFDCVLNNIKQFNLLRNEAKADFLLTRATMVLMDVNRYSFDAYCALLKDHVDIVATGIFHDFKRSRTGALTSGEDQGFACPYLWSGMVIGWDGRVYICSIDGGRECCVGDAKNTPLKSIWLGDRYEEIRRKHIHGKWTDIRICRRCNLIEYFINEDAI